MKHGRAIVLAFFLILGLTAWAQQEHPTAELTLNYSIVRFTPNAAYTENQNLNGGGGAIVYNLNDWFGIKADLQGYASHTSTFIIPPSALAPRGGVFSVDGNLFTYTFGPQVKYHEGRVQPFGEILFGGAHANVYGNLFTACLGVCRVSASPSPNAFAMVVGGGVDIVLNHWLSIRPGQFDYLLTRFSNPFAIANQNNFRYQAGATFAFGGR